MYCPPILFVIFNRPDLTRQVFARVREARPAQLFIAADGPRADHIGEDQLCAEVRSIVDEVDWPCDSHTLFREQNLGCKAAVSGAITWFFDHVEHGVILEDDCLPHPSFFEFCAELLNKYRDDERIMMISGDNFQRGVQRGTGSYYFSKLCHIWGWATWRRAWKSYDLDLRIWPFLRETTWLLDVLCDQEFAKHWRDIFDQVHEQRFDTWDYSWVFGCWAQSGLAIMPNVNLVSNIGFREDATHTKSDSHNLGELPTLQMGFPLKHPDFVVRDLEADLFTHNSQLKSAPQRNSTRNPLSLIRGIRQWVEPK